jgi:PAS domain-containing protein
MSAVFTYSEARQNFASILERAINEGEVRIKRRDGQIFVIRPELATGSPLDIVGVDLDITRDEIIAFIAEGRRYS